MPKKKTTPTLDQVAAPAVGQEGAESGSQSAPTSYTPPEEGIGERIRARREELRLNYEELARLTAKCDYWGKGLSGVSLARYEKGEALPGARELRLLCESLRLPPEWLLLGVDRLDQAKGAVVLANKLVALLRDAESFQAIDPSSKDDSEWLWSEKLREIQRPRTQTTDS
jgi:transcriptional regulator with XRE-family HTH domain